jgi:hypothetical protein
MTVATIDITETILLTALRGFLLSAVSGDVVQSQQNRVAMPKGTFTIMTPIDSVGISVNRKTYHDTGVAGTGTEGNTQSKKWRCQLDCYGAQAHDNATLISTLWRTPYACGLFITACQTLGIPSKSIAPLYAGDPHNTNMINAEEQFQDRWTLDVTLQFNPTVTVPQDFAAQLIIGLAEVDAKFPPGATK